MGEQAVLTFGELLRRLRVEARLTQEELAEAARLSPRSISDLERGVNRTARKDTAELLADALDLAGSARTLFLAAARGRGPVQDVLAAREEAPLAALRPQVPVPSAPARHNLPAPLTSFLGREQDLARLDELLGEARLVTLTGNRRDGQDPAGPRGRGAGGGPVPGRRVAGRSGRLSPILAWWRRR